jgi:aspartyl-tRNA(Asn)/glutamyl-tRNA(Gln) amidotransferase subunit B
MSNYKPAFGIEVHAELLTNTKAFSPAKVDLHSAPNTNVHPIDVGYPGTKPTVNKKMVEFAYRIGQ